MSDASSSDDASSGAADTPLVSCLMVTADRRELAQRAIRCYLRQTYPKTELVVVDDGTQDMTPVLDDVPDDELNYVKLAPENNVLGKLRNVALDHADGALITQWDDDDWYHETRVETQAAVLQSGYDACSLHGALMHIDDPEFMYNPYVGFLENGVPGTIMHRRDTSIRYPEMRRAEDSVFLDAWKKQRYTLLSDEHAHLFIRCFHGSNTWEKKHFLTRMRNTPRDLLLYGYHRFVKGDLFSHPRFRITDAAWTAFQRYVRDSVDFDLFDTPVDDDRVDSLA